MPDTGKRDWHIEGGGADAAADQSITAADRGRSGFSRWAWRCRAETWRHAANRLCANRPWAKTRPPLLPMDGLSSSCPHLHRSQSDGCHWMPRWTFSATARSCLRVSPASRRS